VCSCMCTCMLLSTMLVPMGTMLVYQCLNLCFTVCVSPAYCVCTHWLVHVGTCVRNVFAPVLISTVLIYWWVVAVSPCILYSYCVCVYMYGCVPVFVSGFVFVFIPGCVSVFVLVFLPDMYMCL